MVCSVKPGATQCWTGKPVLKTPIFQFDLACSRLCFQSFNHKRWRRKVCVNQVCQCGSYWLITCLFKYQNSHRMERLKGQPPHTAVAAASGWRLDSSTCGGWEAWLMLLCSGALRGAEISICAEGPVVLNAACQRWGRLHNTQGLGATTTRRWISIERAKARDKTATKKKTATMIPQDWNRPSMKRRVPRSSDMNNTAELWGMNIMSFEGLMAPIHLPIHPPAHPIAMMTNGTGGWMGGWMDRKTLSISRGKPQVWLQPPERFKDTTIRG